VARTESEDQRAATFGQDALRGAVVALLWSSAVLAFLGAVRAAGHPAILVDYADLVFGYAHAFFEDGVLGARPYVIAGTSIGAATFVGAALGTLAGRIRARVWIRCILLIVLSVPGLWMLIYVVFVLGSVQPTSWSRNDVSALPGFAGIALLGLVMIAPVAVLPAALGMIMLEGWTRPAGTRVTGMARSEVRGWTIRVLVLATAAFAAVASHR